MYYLELTGYQWNENLCSNGKLEFYCTLYPKKFRYAPAAIERQRQTNPFDNSPVDVDYIMKLANVSREIFLYVSEVEWSNNILHIDPDNLKIANQLQNKVLIINTIYPDLKVVKFSRN